MRHVVYVVLALSIACNLGCSSYPALIDSREQPPSDRILFHRVEQGETLYSIAWRYDLSTRVLCEINDVKSPYEIKVGQIVNLNTDVTYKNRLSDGLVRVKSTSKATTSTKTEREDKHPNPLVQNQSYRDISTAGMRWPVKGTVVENYNRKELRKGIVIEGLSGAAVRPAAQGMVVYAGDGLRAYGKLIIIKHSDDLLSAYAYSEKILVTEGQTVGSNELISKLGPQGRLYFEIRKDGYPVEPQAYLR